MQREQTLTEPYWNLTPEPEITHNNSATISQPLAIREAATLDTVLTTNEVISPDSNATIDREVEEKRHDKIHLLESM